jgi:serine/threonine-protein kinase HipA
MITMAKTDPLGVWLHGVRVADLTSSAPGEVRCRYSAEALERWPLNTPLLSCSLPLSARRQRSDVFFSGLLPEGQHRQAMASEANVATYDTFGLLDRYGRDVAGAVVISRDEPEAHPGDVEPYSAESLEAEVVGLPGRPLGLYDDSELSIAGLQDKLLLIELDDGRWGRPIHGRPSTHILKVEDRRFPGMAEHEAACLRLAAVAGLTTVDVTVESFGGIPCIIVSRYDRQIISDGVERIHQEDSCQALGRDPDANGGRGKYERSGGPSLLDVARLLDEFARDPVEQLERLVRVVAFTTIVGNADAHGKNVSLLHESADSVSLAPLYDTVPTALWPKLRPEAAMAVNGRWKLDAVTVDDLVAEAGHWPLAPEAARRAALVTGETLASAAGDPAIPERLAEHVTARCDSFSRMGVGH